jgi:hypothetical protein
LNEGGRFSRSEAGACSLTEVVAAGIKKLEPVEAADFGRVEIERPEHEAGTTLGQKYVDVRGSRSPRSIPSRIRAASVGFPKHADQHRPKGLVLPSSRFDNHDQNRGASLKPGRSGTKVEHNAHYLVLSFDGTLIPSTRGDRWWMWQSSRVHRDAVRR